MAANNWEHLERLEREAAVALKTANPGIKVLASRNTEVLTSVWDSTRSLILPPGPSNNPDIFVRAPAGASSCKAAAPAAASIASPATAIALKKRHNSLHPAADAQPLSSNDSRFLCNGSWSCDHCGRPPAPTEIPYGKLYWNWTDPTMHSVWLNRHALPPVVDGCTVRLADPETGAPATLPCFDGVYWDCSCGSVGVPSGDLPAFMASAQTGFDAHLPVFAALGKASIAWDGEQVQAASCEADMQRLIAGYGPASPLYNDTTLQLRWDLDPSSLNLTVQAFLVLRPPSALLMFQVEGAYECASGACGSGEGKGYPWPQELDVDWGVPLEPAGGKLVAPGVWERAWSKGVARVNCSAV